MKLVTSLIAAIGATEMTLPEEIKLIGKSFDEHARIYFSHGVFSQIRGVIEQYAPKVPGHKELIIHTADTSQIKCAIITEGKTKVIHIDRFTPGTDQADVMVYEVYEKDVKKIFPSTFPQSYNFRAAA